MSKRKVWVASISNYEHYIVEPEDISSLMYLSGRMRHVSGYPKRLTAADGAAQLCSNISFEEVEMDENEVEELPAAAPTPRLEPF